MNGRQHSKAEGKCLTGISWYTHLVGNFLLLGPMGTWEHFNPEASREGFCLDQDSTG